MRDLIFRIIYWRKIRRARRFIHTKEGEEWNRMLMRRARRFIHSKIHSKESEKWDKMLVERLEKGK